MPRRGAASAHRSSVGADGAIEIRLEGQDKITGGIRKLTTALRGMDPAKRARTTSRTKVDGLGPLAKKLEALADGSIDVVGAALYQEANIEMTESLRLVPVDTGDLKATGHATLPESKGDTVSVTLGYGGPAVNYALAVHEDMSAFHDDGQAKYLEQPVLEAAPHLSKRVAEAVKRFLRKL